jgi:hypothetical protein
MGFLEDGWVTWARGSELDGVVVHAQVYSDSVSPRGDLTTLIVTGRNLTTDKLRSIPVGRIEALALTNPEFAPRAEGSEPGPMTEAQTALMRAASSQFKAQAYRRKPRKPLTRPDGSNPDAFYRQVAEAYRYTVQHTRKVAMALAEEADVPVGTVHRWIREARRRGFLPAARRGRAG